MVSISFSAASTRALYPVVMFWGITISFANDGGRAPRQAQELPARARRGTMAA
jgi:hypothetical protein